MRVVAPSKAFERPASHRLVTTILVNLSAIIERTDEQLLPASYAFVAASLDASPRQLGYLTQCRALVQALTSPLGGLAGHYFNRIYVLAFGVCFWGLMTAIFSGCTTLTQGYFVWAFNGIGLALVVPTGQSLTADYFSEQSRGAAFGALYLTGAVGAMLGTAFATNTGHLRVVGVEGWRFAFFTVACISILIGLLNLLFARDPTCSSRWQLKQSGVAPSLRGVLADMKKVCAIPTFLIIVVQGIVGALPWNALVFLTLYLQTIGMSDAAASFLVSLFLGGTALGGLLGGALGDLASAAFPDTGRIAVCQLSVIAGVPFSVLLLKGLPLNGEGTTVALYAAVLGCMGLLISWAAPACNNPLFAQIVPSHLRTMIFAFDRSFETAIAASAAPVVGILAEKVFGWQGSASLSVPGQGGGARASSLRNAQSLGNALVVCMTIPWFLCCCFYTGLYYTYPKDREKAAEAAQLMIHNADAQHFDASPIGEESRGLLNTVDSTGRIESELELAPLRQEAFLSHNRRNHQF